MNSGTRSLALLLMLALGSWAGGSLDAIAQDSGNGAITSVADLPVIPGAEVEQMMQDVSNWGRWGEDDQLGTLNLITPSKRAEAADLVREGISVSMSFNPPTMPAEDAPTPLEMTIQRVANGSVALDTWEISHHGLTFSHLDALCHWSFDGRMYNGFDSDEISPEGCQKLGIETMKDGIVSRGVIVDIPRMRGVPYLEPSVPITRADIEAWEAYAGVEIGAGDVVLFRTGRFGRRADQGPFSIQGAAAGLHVSAVPFLKERDVALVGSDAGLDVAPTGVDGIINPVHTVLLVSVGMAIIDNADLEAVAETAARFDRPDFMFVGAPIPVAGATGSLLNAVAVF